MGIDTEKHKLRKFILNKLKTQITTERIEKSKRIEEKIILSREFVTASVIMLYAAMSYEVETSDIIEQAFRSKKKVLLPRMKIEKKEIVPYEIKNLVNDTELSPYGFREPLSALAEFERLDEIALVIVPGLAFDSEQHRLGRGAGYYDRFLTTLPASAYRMGVGFDFQILPSIPHDTHDQRVHRVISN
jgi:5-formyltetrahydrofolate cyclo-ligase